MPSKKDKKESDEQYVSATPHSSEVGGCHQSEGEKQTNDAVENPEPKPPEVEKEETKTIHVYKKDYIRLNDMRENIPGINKQETFAQVVEHMLSIFDSVRRMLVLDDEGILDFALNDIDDAMRKMAEYEEELERIKQKKK